MKNKDRIMMTIYEEKDANEVRAIASEWLDIDDLINSIKNKLSKTEDIMKIQKLEELVWKK